MYQTTGFLMMNNSMQFKNDSRVQLRGRGSEAHVLLFMVRRRPVLLYNPGRCSKSDTCKRDTIDALRLVNTAVPDRDITNCGEYKVGRFE